MIRAWAWVVITLILGPVAAPQPPAAPSIAAIESLIRSGDYDSAVQAAQARLHVVPSDFRCWTLEGIIFSMQGKNDAALGAFAKALKISPSYVPALKGEVQLLYPTGDKRAIPLLQGILRTDPNDATAHEMLAVLQRRDGKCDQAIEQFLLAKDAIDTHRESLEAFGYCLVEAKQWQNAGSVFQRLEALMPDAVYPKYDLALVDVALKQNQVAVDALEPLLTPDQNDTDVLSLASEAYEAVGNTPRAVALLRQAIVLSPTTPDYYVQFALICLDHDSFQTGIDMLNAGLQRLPENANLYLSRGMLYAQLGEYDPAEADFSKAEELDSKQGLSFYAADLSQMQRNRPDEALAQVRSQLKADPESPLLNLLLAKLIMNQTPDPGSASFNEAMRAVLLAIDRKPDLVDARDLLASMYMSSGDYDHAIEQCRLVLQSAPADESATYHLMISLRHKGEKNELPALVKRLAELHQESLKAETDRKRYRLVEESPPPTDH